MTAAPPHGDEDSSIAKAGERLIEQLLKVGLNGFGPFKSAEESAGEALKGRTPEEAVKALIRNHCAIAGAQGFVTNLGGIVTLPITLPANIGASYLVQTHLAGAIAAVHGHDLDAEAVRSAILLCLVGNAGTEVVKRFGIKVSSKLTITMIERIPIEVIRGINKRVGFMLIAKFGTKRSVITLAKWVPMVGGVVGGGVDTAATWAVGTYAHRAFQRSDGKPVGGAVAM